MFLSHKEALIQNVEILNDDQQRGHVTEDLMWLVKGESRNNGNDCQRLHLL